MRSDSLSIFIKKFKTSFAFIFLYLFISSVFAAVDLPNGNYSESVEELRVKVLGGYVVVERHHVEDRWQINPHWNSLQFTLDNFDGAINNISRHGSIYNRVGDVWSASDNRSRIRRQSVSLLPPAPASVPASGIPGAGGQTLTSVLGFRWSETTGNWIEYDAQGRIAVYGDKNDVKVWFQHDANGKLKYVLDHFGRVVLTYTWSGESLTQIEDNPALISGNTTAARVVKFYYEGVSQTTPPYPLLVRVSDVLGYDTTFTYTQDRVASITDAENRTRTLTYGATGRVDKVQEADGAETSYQYEYDRTKRQFYVRITYPQTQAGRSIEEVWYDSEGQVIRRDLNSRTRSTRIFDGSARSEKSTDLRGLITTLQRDEYGNPSKTMYADGSFTTSRYSALHGQLLEETDELGVKTSYEYDLKGNVLRVIEAVGLPEQRITEYTYDNYGQPLSLTEKGSSITLPNNTNVTIADATIRHEYDQQGNRIKTTDAENNITQAQHNLQGNIIRVIDSRGNSWQYSFDGKGRLLSETNPLNHTYTYRYNRAGDNIEVINAENQITRFSYDAQGRQIQITNALDQSRQLSYDAQGRRIAEIDEMGKRIEERSYNLEGQLIETRDGNGNTRRFVYGNNNNSYEFTQIQFPTFTRNFIYDSRYRRIEIHDQLSPTLTYIVKQAFNSRGDNTAVIDANSNNTQFSYDPFRRITQSMNALGGVIKYAYDTRDNLLAVTDSNGNTTTYTYDKNNRRLTEKRPLGQILHYSYDNVGNLTQVIHSTGNKINYRYDAANQMIEETHILAGQTMPVRTIAYNYNKVGALTGYNDNNAMGINNSANYILDSLQRRIEEKVTYGNLNFTMKTTYLPNGAKASFTYPDNFQVTYSYDNAQLLQTMALPFGVITINEKLWDRPKKTTYPGGSVLLQDYDPLMRQTQIKWNDPGQVTLFNYQYTYDPQANITVKQTEHGQYNYQYDQFYRLLQATNPAPLSNETYTYDQSGNRLTDSNKPGVWHYNLNNQLTQSFTGNGQALIYSYDDNGNLIQKTNTTTPTENRQFIYDTANRLIEIKDHTNVTIATYAYDPFNRRIAKTVNGVTTYFLYSHEKLIAEANNTTGQIITQYGWAPDRTSWGIAPVFLRINNQIYYYQNDTLGTPQKLIDQNGQVVWEARKTTFGETIVLSGATITNNLRFPGQYYDQETGLHQNYYRDYDPNLGRYIEEDPLGLNGGINTYTYVSLNPVNFFDPYGREEIDADCSEQKDQGKERWKTLTILERDEACRGMVRCYRTMQAKGPAGLNGACGPPGSPQEACAIKYRKFLKDAIYGGFIADMLGGGICKPHKPACQEAERQMDQELGKK